MNVKQYLKQYAGLQATTAADLKLLRKLQQFADSIPPGFHGGRADKALGKANAMKNKVADDISRATTLCARIREQIAAVPDPVQQGILTRRYLVGDSWDVISFDLEFTFQWVHVLHHRALEAFEEIHKGQY